MRIDKVNWITAHNYGEPKWHLPLEAVPDVREENAKKSLFFRGDTERARIAKSMSKLRKVGGGGEVSNLL